jgi:hypothetical protein
MMLERQPGAVVAGEDDVGAGPLRLRRPEVPVKSVP